MARGLDEQVAARVVDVSPRHVAEMMPFVAPPIGDSEAELALPPMRRRDANRSHGLTRAARVDRPTGFDGDCQAMQRRGGVGGVDGVGGARLGGVASCAGQRELGEARPDAAPSAGQEARARRVGGGREKDAVEELFGEVADAVVAAMEFAHDINLLV
ncbi:hypothetical protein OsI_26414 [Oryza sativa Indica Group]|uniref:Uncharacterized protein n=1 Tax=Oryza sativa subsp. indica TaxID=39946 RepID=A2YMG0_ORYSI|nr:hypothetical protein OsI_26414 [Oryza sativa Indica Group]